MIEDESSLAMAGAIQKTRLEKRKTIPWVQLTMGTCWLKRPTTFGGQYELQI